MIHTPHKQNKDLIKSKIPKAGKLNKITITKNFKFPNSFYGAFGGPPNLSYTIQITKD